MLGKMISVVVVVALAVGGWLFLKPANQKIAKQQMTAAGSSIVAVQIPSLDGAAALGARAFEGKCAACHGTDAGGLDGKGPPLIHKIYEPGHHGDVAFVRAAREGVRSHHWPFGDMPPVTGITAAEISDIIAYVRTVQQANGVF